MNFEPKKLEDGSLQIAITIAPEELDFLDARTSRAAIMSSFGKTDYCVTCHGDLKYTIECYGDIAANIEAAAVCFKETGNPSYALSKGSC